ALHRRLPSPTSPSSTTIITTDAATISGSTSATACSPPPISGLIPAKTSSSISGLIFLFCDLKQEKN
ncbi:hypothetical protein U1Q18_009436, partial [Sarracenia purpurea var. burkii]